MTDLDAVLEAHDALLARRSVDVWVGAIPAFALTDSPHVLGRQLGPFATAHELWRDARDEWAAASTAGLHTAGGGFVLGLGGQAAASSPFVRYPHVLPALIRYLNNHPSLSYWFASECVGSASQGPRPDEGARERWDELGVDARLARAPRRSRRARRPSSCGTRSAPLLVDAAGNSHRAELNVEKLWNPHIAAHGPRHGKMGVVELRAIRMPERPACSPRSPRCSARSSRGSSSRTTASRSSTGTTSSTIGSRCRPRSSAICASCSAISTSTASACPRSCAASSKRGARPGITCRLGDATLELRPALEFWPLVGDVASQERAGARWSTPRRSAGSSRSTAPAPIASPSPAGGPSLARSATARARSACAAASISRRPACTPACPSLDPLVIEWACAGRAQKILLRADGTLETESRAPGLSAARYWPETFPFTINLRRATVAALDVLNLVYMSGHEGGSNWLLGPGRRGCVWSRSSSSW